MPKYYYSGCDHAHRSREAAGKCLDADVRRAKRFKFWGCEDLLKAAGEGRGHLESLYIKETT